MIKRTLEISSEPAHLSVRHRQFVVKRNGVVVGSVPCEDLGMVVVDQPQTTYSHAALAALAESDAVLVVCGRDHLPAAVLLPLSGHSQVVWRVNDQIAASKPLKRELTSFGNRIGSSTDAAMRRWGAAMRRWDVCNCGGAINAIKERCYCIPYGHR